jgi:hypothetical protein
MTNAADFVKAAVTAASLTSVRIVALDTLPTIPGTADFRWAFEQGSLFCLVLVILWFYRRDFKRQRAGDIQRHKDQREDGHAQFNAVVHLVQSNISAMQDMKGTHARLARAVETMNLRHRSGDGDPNDDRA